MEVTVTNIRRIAHDVVIIEFDPAAATHPTAEGIFPKFEPGAHAEIVLPGDITRQYSLFDSHSIAVKLNKESRGGSKAVHALCQGDTFRVNKVLNNFRLKEDAPYSILVAGGIGVVPLYSMAQRLKENNKDFDMVYYGRDDNLIIEELDALHLRARDEGKGYLDLLDRAPEGAQLYVCGPQGLMRQARNLAERYLPPESIHSESFQADGGDGQSFKVKINGKTLDVPADKPITQVLSENGEGILTSCESGTCGTCIMQVISGDVEHRDLVLDEAERAEGLFTPCCSRAAGDALEIKRREKLVDVQETASASGGFAKRIFGSLRRKSSNR